MIKIRKKHRQRLLVFLSDAIKAHSPFHFCKCQKEKSIIWKGVKCVFTRLPFKVNWHLIVLFILHGKCQLYENDVA